MTRKLLIIPAENISSWILKGEVSSRYYNPENFFQEVHILLINEDKPDLQALQIMVGNAKLYLYNYSPPFAFFKKTLGWQPWLINKWVKGVIPLIRKISPNIIRCHGAHLNTYIASRVQKALGIPYVVSLHINPDINIRGDAKTIKEKIIGWSSRKLEKQGLKYSDCVLPVYEPIIPYLISMGIEKYQVCYNVLNTENLLKKNDYQISSPVNVISIGRQFSEKNPENIIKALKYIDNINITFVGDGDLHEALCLLSKKEGLENRVNFIKSLANNDLCKSLHKYDFLALHSDYFEISKVVLESFLVGLPVIINHRKGEPVPELSDDICLRVPNTIDGYINGFKKMIDDNVFRENLGKAAYHTAQEKWAPEKCEKIYVDVYTRYMKK